MSLVKKIITCGTICALTLSIAMAEDIPSPKKMKSWNFRVNNWNLIDYKGATVGYAAVRRVMRERYKSIRKTKTKPTTVIESTFQTNPTSAPSTNYSTHPTSYKLTKK